MRRAWAVWMGLGECLGAASCWAADPSLPIGSALYHRHCVACHAIPPRYVPNDPLGLDNAALVRDAIRRNRGGMGTVAFLTPQDLQDIGAYIAQTSGAAPPLSLGTAERILNWAEWKYQTALTPRAASQDIDVYIARHYSTPNLYVGMDGGSVYLYSPASGLQNLGAINNFLSQAAADGF